MINSYYGILGIKKISNKKEIVSAFRRLARKYHPDVNKDPNAESEFKKIQKAYTLDADIVVIAVPGGVAEEVVRGLGDLSEKIIIDPTNRVARADDGYMDHTVESSNGELIQALAPSAYVVKAFNTLNYRTMIDPGGPVTIPLAGNDSDAKTTVAELVAGMGLQPMDVGPIRSAHVLEGMLTIWINARGAGAPYDYHFRPLEESPEAF